MKIFEIISKKIDEYKMIKIATTSVFKNPMRREFLVLLKRAGELRGLVDTEENLYVWSAGDAVHTEIRDFLVDIDFYDGLFFSDHPDSTYDEWNLKDINGIFFSSVNQTAIEHSKFLQRILGLSSISSKDKKVDESPGFDAGGPSGIMFPRGYNRQAINGMYPTGIAYTGPGPENFNRDSDNIHPFKHIQSIKDRIEGGMSFKQALQAQANETGTDVNELIRIIKKEM